MMGKNKPGIHRESRARPERVRAIDSSGSREKQVISTAPDAAATPPSTLAEDRFLSATCYYCGLKGHLARSCEKKRRDRAQRGLGSSGEGAGEGKAAGAPPSKRN